MDCDVCFRQAVEKVIRLQPSLCLAGSFASSTSALNELPVFRPEVIIIDLLLLEPDGLKCSQHLRRMSSNWKILLTTNFPVHVVLKLIRCIHLNGLLLKSAQPKELVDAIHFAHGGGFALFENPLMWPSTTEPKKDQAPNSLSECVRNSLFPLAGNFTDEGVQAAIARAVRYSVLDLSKFCSISRRTLERTFKARFQKTVHQCMTEWKLREALRLRKFHIPISACAEQLGYQHVRDLYSPFQALFGITVGRYRKELLAAKRQKF